MSILSSHYAEACFALIVTGLGMSPWPWLALVAAGIYFAVMAFIADRRSEPSLEAEE